MFTRSGVKGRARQWYATPSFCGLRPCRPNVRSPCPGQPAWPTSWIPKGAPLLGVSGPRMASEIKQRISLKCQEDENVRDLLQSTRYQLAMLH